MSAKSDFIERMASLHLSTQNPAIAVSSNPNANIAARMFRNGLAVVGFAALEDFIKVRTSEVLSAISGTAVPFSSLPEKLRYATTFGAVSALNYQLSILPDKLDRIGYMQDQAQKIWSTSNSTEYSLTPHAFGFSQANITKETIKDILSSFLIKNPWDNMTTIAQKLNFTSFNLEVVFRNAASRRHKAAHVPHFDVPQNDLTQFIMEAFGISIGFDALISKAFLLIQSNDTNYLQGTTEVNHQSILIRTVRFISSQWTEFPNNPNTTGLISHSSFEDAKTMATTRASSSKETLVLFNSAGLPSEWECF